MSTEMAMVVWAVHVFLYLPAATVSIAGLFHAGEGAGGIIVSALYGIAFLVIFGTAITLSISNICRKRENRFSKMQEMIDYLEDEITVLVPKVDGLQSPVPNRQGRKGR